jgi:predicted phosphodiesterase
MLLRIVSDLHTEFYNFNKFKKTLQTYLPCDDRDKDSILILAGDCGVFSQYPSTIKPLLNLLSSRFRHILYVYGNHEFYGGANWVTYRDFWRDKSIPVNLTVLDNDYKIIDDTVFIGSTLWTSMDNRNPLATYHCGKGMTDYRSIRYSGAANPYGPAEPRIVPEDTVDRFEENVKFIESALHIFKQTVTNKVVITHHLPSFMSVNEMYAGDILNNAFASDLNNFISHLSPNLWIHGHTHNAVDYMLDNTRVICNPAGYHAHENPLQHGYIDRLFVEI